MSVTAALVGMRLWITRLKLPAEIRCATSVEGAKGDIEIRTRGDWVGPKKPFGLQA